MFQNRFYFYCLQKENKCDLDLCHYLYGCLQGQKDVALFTEAASIFHHNDLRIFPFCQPDELDSVRVSGSNTFFLLSTNVVREDVEHFEPL